MFPGKYLVTRLFSNLSVIGTQFVRVPVVLHLNACMPDQIESEIRCTSSTAVFPTQPRYSREWTSTQTNRLPSNKYKDPPSDTHKPQDSATAAVERSNCTALADSSSRTRRDLKSAEIVMAISPLYSPIVCRHLGAIYRLLWID